MYILKDRVASLVQRSRMIYGETLKLNMYENHLSLNKDFDLYCAVFHCKTCTNYGMARAIIHDIVRRALLESANCILSAFTKPLRQFFKSWRKLMFLFPKKIAITHFLHDTILNVFCSQ